MKLIYLVDKIKFSRWLLISTCPRWCLLLESWNRFFFYSFNTQKHILCLSKWAPTWTNWCKWGFFYYGDGDFALGQRQNLFLYAWKTLLPAIRTQNIFTEKLMIANCFTNGDQKTSKRIINISFTFFKWLEAAEVVFWHLVPLEVFQPRSTAWRFQSGPQAHRRGLYISHFSLSPITFFRRNWKVLSGRWTRA